MLDSSTPDMKSPLRLPHATPAITLLAALAVDDRNGLDDSRTAQLRKQYGFNQPNESMLSVRLGLVILLQGCIVGIVGLLAFGLSYWNHPGNDERARAMTFCVIVYTELFRALAARSQSLTLGQLGLWTNPRLLLAVAVSGMLQLSVAVFPFTQQVFEVPVHTSFEWSTIAILP